MADDGSQSVRNVEDSAAAAEHNVADAADEEDLEKLQAEIAKMEEEAAKIAAETANLEKSKDSENNEGVLAKERSNIIGANPAIKDGVDKGSVDQRSIYVGQVDYSATPEELLQHFEPCGTVERVTINCDKFTGRPKGFAYLEFQSEESVENAIKLDGSNFKGRTLKVTRKRVNDPNFYHNLALQQQQQQHHHGHPGRGFGGRGFGGSLGRGQPARGFRGRGPPGGRFRGGAGRRGGGRRGGFRGGYSGGAGFHPYY